MAFDMFVKIDGIDGESSDAKHKGEIELVSWNWGEANPTSSHPTPGTGAGKVAMQDFHFVSKIDSTSVKLFLACASGQVIRSGVLSIRDAANPVPGPSDAFMFYKLTDFVVSSYQLGGSVDLDVPTQSFSLNFSKIEVGFRPQLPDGQFGPPLSAGWDLVRNIKL